MLKDTKQQEKNKQLKYYYQVIPLVRLKLTKINVFTYHSFKRISFGSIVQIEFNGKNIRGVIIKKTVPPDFETLTIQKIVTKKQITKKQLALVKLISEYYLTPLSTVLKFFSFKLTKKNNQRYFQDLQKIISKINKTHWREKINLTKEQTKICKIYFNSSKNKFLLFGPPASGKTEILVEIIKKTLAKKQQSLILIPEIFLSYQEIIRYSSKFFNNQIENLAILHSQLRPSEITAIWNGVQSGKIKIIISTRMGVFLPFKNLATIIVDEEQDISHKQWDSPPFYHVREVVNLMQKIYMNNKKKPKIIFSSATPSLQTYYKAMNSKKWLILKLPSLKTKNFEVKNPKIELIDLKKYYKKGQQFFISNKLYFGLKNSLERNETAILLVPQRGKSRLMVCQDCHKTPVCPNCQTPLSHSENFYRCLHCDFKISNISKCPHCGSFRLKDLGFGTESVADKLQTSFPSAKISIADGTTFKDNDYRQKILFNLFNNKIDFLVGTYTIAKGLDVKYINLVAVLNADNWPGQTGFRFDENYLGTLFQLAGRVNRPHSSQKGKCLIQTFNPTDRIFTYLKKWNWEDFLKYEIPNRKSLNYPPFQHLIKITYKNYSRNKVEKETEKFYKKFKNYQKEKNQAINIQIIPPYYGYQEKKRQYWNKHCLLKIKKLPIKDEGLLKILDLPTDWKIDVDTENIF